MITLLAHSAALLLAFDDGTEGVSVSGDAALLQVIIASQEANLAQYKHGRLRASYRGHATRSGIDPVEAEIVLIWDGDSAYREYDYRHHQNGEWSNWTKGVRHVAAPKCFARYFPETNRLILRKDSSTRIPGYLDISPSSIWYTFERSLAWKDLLAPDFGSGHVERIHVDLQEDNKVAFRRLYTSGNVLSVLCDLDVGGNVVSYEATPATHWSNPNAPNVGSRGTFSWIDDERGGFRLAKLRYDRFVKGDEDNPIEFEELEIHEFDPTFVASREQFDLTALRVPRGAEVDEYSPEHRTYYFGGKLSEREALQRQLDELIERSRRSGSTTRTDSDAD